VGVVRREIVRQVDPRRVVVVKVGRQVVGDLLVSRMVAFQILSTVLIVAGSVALALAGVDFLGSVTGAVSMLSTVGPAMGDLGPGRTYGGGTMGLQLALIVLMVAGRLEIYPVARAVAGLVERVGRMGRRLRRLSR
jgi:trk system potassium uptake protein TrkH